MSMAGAGASMFGAELQGWAAFLDKLEMNHQIKQEAARQAGYKEEGAKLFQPALEATSADFAKKALIEGARNREMGYDKVAPYALGQRIGGQIAPTIQDVGYTQSLGKNRAALGAYGDWSSKQGIASEKAQEPINQLASFSRGNSSIFPYRLDEAKHAYDAMAAIGQFIGSIGGAATNFGALYNQVQSPQYGSGYGYGEGQTLDPNLSYGEQPWLNGGY